MADKTEDRDPEGGNRPVSPGGSPSRGANPDPGGKEDAGGLVPPYEGRTGAGSPANTERGESVERQLAETKTGPAGATSSPADEQPVREDQLTDEVPDSPKGVGKSSTRSGETVKPDDGTEAGRSDDGTKGGTDRPVGSSDERDQTSVDPKGS